MSDKRFPVEKIAKLENEKRRQAQPAEPIVELIKELVDRDDTVVLDVGVGTGYFAIPTVKAFPQGRLIGLDVEPQMLEVFADRVKTADVGDRITSLLGALDGPDGIDLEGDSVDVALLVNLYHELDDRPKALKELRRVLRPGGSVVICDWNPEGPSDFGPPADHRIARNVVESELEANGFNKSEQRALYEHFYVVVGR